MLLLAAGVAAAMPAPAMAGAREEGQGPASGLFNTPQVVGGFAAAGGVSTLAAAHTDGLLARGAEPVAATAGGFRPAFSGGDAGRGGGGGAGGGGVAARW